MQAWGRWFLQNLSHLQWQTEHPIRFLGRWASNETALSKKISVFQLNTSLLFFRVARVIALLIKQKTPTPPPFPPKNLQCIPLWFKYWYNEIPVQTKFLSLLNYGVFFQLFLIIRIWEKNTKNFVYWCSIYL